MSKSEFTNDEASYGKNSEAGTEQIGHHWAIGGILWLWSTLHRLAAPLSFDFWAKSALSLCRKQRRDETSDFLGYSAGFGIPNSRKPLASVNSYLLGGLPTLGGPALRAVVDAYFSKAPFLNPCIEAGIGVISRLRHDSKGWDNPPPYSGRGRPRKWGLEWRLKDLLSFLTPQTITVCIYDKLEEVRCEYTNDEASYGCAGCLAARGDEKDTSCEYTNDEASYGLSKE